MTAEQHEKLKELGRSLTKQGQSEATMVGDMLLSFEESDDLHVVMGSLSELSGHALDTIDKVRDLFPLEEGERKYRVHYNVSSVNGSIVVNDRSPSGAKAQVLEEIDYYELFKFTDSKEIDINEVEEES
jgi:hypothetical protein